MIINIKGTSGSGKTTLVRKVMDCYDTKGKVYVEGRKQPLGYLCHKEGHKSLAVIGHYETPCGGCDTINKMDDIFDLVRKSHEKGYNVIFEGLLISADVNRTAALHHEGLPLTVLAIDIPLQDCLDSINGRRKASWELRCKKIEQENEERQEKGLKLKELPPKPDDVNPKNTESKWRGVKLCMNRLLEAGVDARWGSRNQCLTIIKEKLNV